MNTHYGVIVFGGDFGGDHPDPELRGTAPSMILVACGPQAFCWQAIAGYTQANPLRRDEAVEVLARDLLVVTDQKVAADHYIATMHEATAAEPAVEEVVVVEPRAADEHGEWAIRIYDDQPVPEGTKYAPENRVVLLRAGVQVREFLYPGYRIWTLLAHWTEGLDELAAVLDAEPAAEEES